MALVSVLYLTIQTNVSKMKTVILPWSWGLFSSQVSVQWRLWCCAVLLICSTTHLMLPHHVSACFSPISFTLGLRKVVAVEWWWIWLHKGNQEENNHIYQVSTSRRKNRSVWIVCKWGRIYLQVALCLLRWIALVVTLAVVKTNATQTRWVRTGVRWHRLLFFSSD